MSLRMWNPLPQIIRKVKSIAKFKTQINRVFESSDFPRQSCKTVYDSLTLMYYLYLDFILLYLLKIPEEFLNKID